MMPAAGLRSPSNRRLLNVRRYRKSRGGLSMQRTKLVLLATLFALSSGIARAQISDDVVKIGVLTDLSGPAATATGPGSVAAARSGGRRFRRQGSGQANPGHFRRSSDQARSRGRHRPAMVRPRSGRSDRRRAGVSRWLGGAKHHQQTNNFRPRV